MATIADFRKSVSELSQDELLERIIQLRTERRMMPEKILKAEKKSAAKGKKQPKQMKISDYLNDLNNEEKQMILANLMKLKR